MSQVLLAKVQIPNLSPVNDPSTMGFVFESATAADYSHVSAITTALIAFFNSIPATATNNIASYLSLSTDHGASHCSITYYDITSHLNGSPHGAPVAAANWGLGGSPTGTPFPEGAAAALSFRADYGTDVEFGTGTRPRARDRNRFYLGPLNSSCAEIDSSTKRTQFNSTFISNCLAAMFDLSNTHTTGGVSYNWRVWSRKNAGVKLITELFMDNRIDYQRRRSDPAPATRTYLPASSV